MWRRLANAVSGSRRVFRVSIGRTIHLGTTAIVNRAVFHSVALSKTAVLRPAFVRWQHGQPQPWVSPEALPSGENLKRYSRDLTEAARQGKLDPVIGRDDEIRRTLQVLARRTKNNPVLIGEPGVGVSEVASRV